MREAAEPRSIRRAAVAAAAHRRAARRRPAAPRAYESERTDLAALHRSVDDPCTPRAAPHATRPSDQPFTLLQPDLRDLIS